MDTVKLPRKLTAENGAKCLLRGEFSVRTEIANPEYCGCGNCDFCRDFPEEDETITQEVTIGWDIIKRIYDKIVENLEIIDKK